MQNNPWKEKLETALNELYSARNLADRFETDTVAGIDRHIANLEQHTFSPVLDEEDHQTIRNAQEYIAALLDLLDES